MNIYSKIAIFSIIIACLVSYITYDIINPKNDYINSKYLNNEIGKKNISLEEYRTQHNYNIQFINISEKKYNNTYFIKNFNKIDNNTFYFDFSERISLTLYTKNNKIKEYEIKQKYNKNATLNTTTMADIVLVNNLIFMYAGQKEYYTILHNNNINEIEDFEGLNFNVKMNYNNEKEEITINIKNK